MAKKSSATFAKRQREIAKKEKQQQKMEKRLERKKAKAEGGGTNLDDMIDYSLAVTGPYAYRLEEGYDPEAEADEQSEEEESDS